MKKYHMALSALLAFALTACVAEESELTPDNTEQDPGRIFGYIMSPIQDPASRTMIDGTQWETHVHTLWCYDDRIGLFNTYYTSQGWSNSTRTFTLRESQLRNKKGEYKVTTQAEFEPVGGSLSGGTLSKFHYAYYPYTKTESSVEWGNPIVTGSTTTPDLIPDHHPTVTWTLDGEQEWNGLESIADRDWMVSKATMNPSTNVTNIIFRPLTTLLRFWVVIDYDINDDMQQIGDIISIKIEPATGTTPYADIVGTYTFDLTYLDGITAETWNVKEGEHSFIDLTEMWEAPDSGTGSKELTVLTTNVSSVNTPTRAFANIAPTLRQGDKIKVTIETTNTYMVAEPLTVAQNMQAGKVYDVPLYYNDNTEGSWTVTAKESTPPAAPEVQQGFASGGNAGGIY